MSLFELSEENVLAVVTPIAENMQVGWDEDDYEQFPEHFSDEMKSDVDIDNYAKQRMG
ncbi:MAG: hypothetical protein F6K10_03025 [Moorea sp. SIO2B7]|nr:hypothetical protein [Moorena sp. SIO2B7]